MPVDARSDAELLARFRRLLWYLAAALAVAELLAATGIVHEPLSAVWTQYGFGQFVATALGGAFVLHLLCRPPLREAAAIVALAIAAEVTRVVLQTRAGWARGPIIAESGLGAGIASLAAQAAFAWRARGEARQSRQVVLSAGLILVGFVLSADALISLTAALHPLTLDALPYAFDASLGGQPSFALGRLFRRLPALARVSELVYVATPIGFGLMWAAERRARTRPAVELMTAFVVASFSGFVLYHAFPIAGPVFVFGTAWPAHPPAVAAVGLISRMAEPMPRNCMPSLHTTWVLLLWWHSRGRGVAMRAVALIFLVFTLLATLGDGVHYLVDLVVAVPFAAAVQVACAASLPRRWRAFALLAALVAAWLIALRTGILVRHPNAALSWALVVATVGVALALERRVWFAAQQATAAAAIAPVAEDPAASIADGSERRLTRALCTVVFLSGFAGLLHAVVAEKTLATTFGESAPTSMLAMITGGLALGAIVGARVAARRSDALRAYAACALAMALFGAALPWLARGVPSLYVLLAGVGDPARPVVAATEVMLGALVRLPPMFLLGMTAPLVARHLMDRRYTLGRSVAAVWAATAFGAAVGALLAGYLFLPSLGAAATVWLAAAAELAAVVVALRLRARTAASADGASEEPGAPASFARGGAWRPSLLLGISGAVTLGVALVYGHLLAIVAGDGAYAAPRTLASLLLALGVGATAAVGLSRRGVDAALAVALALFGLAVCLLGGVFFWDGIEGYFASFEHYALARTFGAREVVRLVVGAVVVIPPAACAGAACAAAVQWLARETTRPVAAIGRAAALPLAGGVVGALAVAPVVARLGSLRALQALALVAFASAAMALVDAEVRRRVFLLPFVAATAVLLLAQPRHLDIGRISSGANVYFTHEPARDVVDWAESIDGGLTVVATSRSEHGTRALTVVVDGKPTNNDREPATGAGRVDVPLLTAGRDRALVIGLGSGATAAAATDAGFAAIDVVDGSADVLSLYSRWLARGDDGVLRRPVVTAHIADARRWLLLGGARYDLIAVERTSRWNAAALYNREFYQLAAAALSDRGVLRQWLPLHRLTPLDLASAIASAHSVFPHIALDVANTDGAIVACMAECGAVNETRARTDAHWRLDTAALDRLLAAAAKEQGGSVDELVSTDDNGFLEYHAPRTSVRSYAPSLQLNLRWLAMFAAGGR